MSTVAVPAYASTVTACPDSVLRAPPDVTATSTAPPDARRSDVSSGSVSVAGRANTRPSGSKRTLGPSEVSPPCAWFAPRETVIVVFSASAPAGMSSVVPSSAGSPAAVIEISAPIVPTTCEMEPPGGDPSPPPPLQPMPAPSSPSTNPANRRALSMTPPRRADATPVVAAPQPRARATGSRPSSTAPAPS
jgi:hypothetical protein